MEWAVGSLYAQYVPFFFISLACSLCSDVTLFLQAKKQLCQSAINEGVLAKLPVTVRVTFICPCCKWKNNALLPNPLLTKATLAPFPPPAAKQNRARFFPTKFYM